MRTYTGGTLYKECVLTEEKNFVVEGNLANALTNNWSSIRSSASDGAISFGNVQYQKIKLNMKLKLICNETFVTKSPSDTYNYLFLSQTIYNDDDSVSRRDFYFFFVKKCTWLSQNCVEVELKLDTLNTYHTRLSSGVGINAKSHILRRHKDRFDLMGISQDETKFYLNPLVDFYSEGISALKYRQGNADTILNDSAEGFNTNWYLVYKNNEELDSNSDLSKAVQCFLYSEGEQTISAYAQTTTKNLYELAYGDYSTSEPDSSWWHCIYLTYEDNGPTAFTFYHIENNVRIVDGILTLGDNTIVVEGVTKHFFFYSIAIYWTNVGVLEIKVYSDTGTELHRVEWPSATYVDSDYFVGYRKFVGIRSGYQDIPHTLRDIDDKATYYSTGSSGRNTFKTYPFYKVNRSDATLIKVLKMPYCPLNLTGGNVRPNWKTGGLEVLDTTSAFNRAVTCSVNQTRHPFYPLKQKEVLVTDVTNNNTQRNINYEPKLYHSDYYTPKFVYDSFAFEYKLETQDVDEVQTLSFTNFTFDFTMTSTINSRFMFTFNFMSEGTNTYTTDFENILVVARNNEMTIFNQQYINYLRAGYNYDVKSKTRTEAVTWANVGLGIGGGAMAGAMAGGGAGAVVGAVIGGISAVIGAIKTTIDAEENFARKQDELKLQSASVYGADDVDLMSKYTSNRARLVVYQVSQKIRNLIYNLFYYYGYVSDEHGNPFTNGWATSRNNFNYLQCELVFNTQWGDNDIMEDITNRYKEGATIFHKTTSGSNTNFYDFDQTLENWETTIHS